MFIRIDDQTNQINKNKQYDYCNHIVQKIPKKTIRSTRYIFIIFSLNIHKQ